MATLLGSMSSIPSWVFIVVLIVGLLLAFFGRAIFDIVMSVIGALIGSIFGFILGFYLFGGWVIPLIMAALFGIIGSLIFKFLIQVALAFLCSVAAAFLVWILMGKPALTDFYLIAIIILIVVFTISYYFIEETVSILTAFIGGVLTGIGLYAMNAGIWAAVGLAILAFIGGAILQIYALEKYDKVTYPD